MDFDESRILSRRATLGTLAGGSLVLLAGCLGEEDVPDPLALDEGQACDNCNMVIDRHGGPAGQSFYLDEPPEAIPGDRPDGVAWFCSTWCLYSFVFEQEEAGFEPVGSYATDYSGLSYEITEDAGAEVITAHLAAGDFERLDSLTLVVDSDVSGAMGSSLIGFSDEDDASAFGEKYGGELMTHGEITPDVIAAMGA